MSEEPAARRRRILDRARHAGRVEVTELARVLEVAAETVRRDLQVLEDQGMLRRIHGGARPVETARFETHLKDRSRCAAPEKGRIAEAALTLLESCESLFIDEGSTALGVASSLRTVPWPLTVITHSIAVATVLASRPETDVLVLGGRLRPASVTTVGSHATAMLAHFTVDAAVLSASGISLERGVSTTDPETAEIKRLALRAARRRILVGDHSKFGIASFCRFGGVESFDAIVTDGGLSGALVGQYKAHGVRLVRA